MDAQLKEPKVDQSTVPAFVAVASRPTQYFSTEEGSIAFDDTGGDGPLVVAIPGMGDLRGEYRYLVPLLTASGHRVVTLDVRGHGESSAQWKDVSAHAIGRDVLALMTHLGQQQAVLIGNSFSAGSALWAAHDAPERVRAVVMIGPVVRDPKNLPWYIKAVLAIGLGGPWRVGFWLTYWNSLFPSRKPTDVKPYREALGRNLREPARMDALKRMIYLSKGDTEAMLETSGKMGKPTLVVMGTKDADFPDPAAEAQWVASKTGADVVLLQGAGHYPQTEMPEQFGPALQTFFSKYGL